MNPPEVNPNSLKDKALIAGLSLFSQDLELKRIFSIDQINENAKLDADQKIGIFGFLANKTLPDIDKVDDRAFKNITNIQSEIPLIKNEFKKMTNVFPYSRVNRNMSVAIVGSGISGIISAFHCVRAGFQTTIYEKESDFGGTWNFKIYPGARCDVQGNLYTYANHQKLFDSPYLSHEEIKNYLRETINEFDLSKIIRYSTEVISGNWRDSEKVWQLELKSKTEGLPKCVNHNFLVVSTGQLDTLNFPKIANRARFKGTVIHANKWPKSLEIQRSKVCLVGSGATSSQLLPQLVRDGNYVNYSFRTPAYFTSVPYYRKKFDKDWLINFEKSPVYRDTYRMLKFHESLNGNLANVKKNSTKELENSLKNSMTEQLNGREDLTKILIPNYPLGAKRILLDDGSFFSAISSSEVRVVHSAPREYHQNGIIFQDDTIISANYIILATGFDSTSMFTNFPLIGQKATLSDYWGCEPRAYLGIMVPSFPNLFLMFGPNTNVVVNGSNTFMAECQAEFIVNRLISVADNSSRGISVHESAMNLWEQYVSSKNMEFNWSQTETPSWYVNRFGKSFTNFPGNSLDYWNLTTYQEKNAFVIF
jgi:4-hydroxyacetophenone monooxygenase